MWTATVSWVKASSSLACDGCLGSPSLAFQTMVVWWSTLWKVSDPWRTYIYIYIHTHLCTCAHIHISRIMYLNTRTYIHTYQSGDSFFCLFSLCLAPSCQTWGTRVHGKRRSVHCGVLTGTQFNIGSKHLEDHRSSPSHSGLEIVDIIYIYIIFIYALGSQTIGGA